MRRINQVIKHVFLMGESGNVDAHLGDYTGDDDREIVRHAVSHANNSSHEIHPDRSILVVTATSLGLLLQGRLSDHGVCVNVHRARDGEQRHLAGFKIQPSDLEAIQASERERGDRNRKIIEQMQARGEI